MSGFPKKDSKGQWKHDFRVGGRSSPRRRGTFDTKSEALEFEKREKRKWDEKETLVRKKYDGKKLSELAQVWFDLKGIKLKDGVRRRDKLKATACALGDPIGKKLEPLEYAEYQAKLLNDGAAKKTLNNELGYLKAMFNFLYKLNAISFPNPLDGVEFIKLDKSKITYLEKSEIKELFTALKSFGRNPHVALISEICLSTGGRWGEVEGLTRKLVQNNKVILGNEQSRKAGEDRAVPINSQLFNRIHEHFKNHGEFTSSIGAFRRALAKTEIKLPKGQATHVLRHTFASHFMIDGGNILVLKEILGHSCIKMTMKYAHLRKTHLQEALEFNPSKHIPD